MCVGGGGGGGGVCVFERDIDVWNSLWRWRVLIMATVFLMLKLLQSAGSYIFPCDVRYTRTIFLFFYFFK